MNKMIKRMKQPTPKFFKKLRTVGIIAATSAATLIAAPIALPAVVVQLASYLAVAGTIMSTVSQVAVTNEAK